MKLSYCCGCPYLRVPGVGEFACGIAHGMEAINIEQVKSCPMLEDDDDEVDETSEVLGEMGCEEREGSGKN